MKSLFQIPKLQVFFALSIMCLIAVLISVYGIDDFASMDTEFSRCDDFNKSNTWKQIKMDIPGGDEISECFESPFVICLNHTKFREWKPEKMFNLSTPMDTNDSKSNGFEKPLIIASLVEENFLYKLFKEFDFEQCPLPCQFTSRDNLSIAKGVIIDGRIATEKDFPKKRYDGQIYIAVLYESPLHSLGTVFLDKLNPTKGEKKGTPKYKDQINLLSTYRRDSDIPAYSFYGILCLNGAPRKSKHELRKMYKEKLRTAVWFVSNCEAQSKRMAYVKELQKYIDVDIYGKCGINSYKKLGSERALLTSTYKFYLAFENSFCSDYVTEKFFKLFHPAVYIVPVVRGGMNYEKYFPPNTFINVRSFETPAELAGYLEDVGGDFEQYSVFLENRDKYMKCPQEYSLKKRMCSLCTLLRSNRIAMKSRYKKISQMVSSHSCYEPKDLPMPKDKFKYIP